MADYKAPLQDMAFVMNELGVFQTVADLPGNGDLSDELVGSILEAAGKFAGDVLAPLNQSGDRHGCRMEDDTVRTPDGFREAYSTFAADGWTAGSLATLLMADRAYPPSFLSPPKRFGRRPTWPGHCARA